MANNQDGNHEHELISEVVDSYFAHILFIHNMTDEEFDAYIKSNYPTEKEIEQMAQEQGQ